jgi:type I restriction enzyme R subunit
MIKYNEDNLVQQTTADYLENELGWENIYAYNQENYGENSLLGRKDQKQIILERYLKSKLKEFNSGLPEEAYKSAIRKITEINASQNLLASNQDKYKLFLDGVQVDYTEQGKNQKKYLKIFDFDQPTNNHFLIVRELWIQGLIYRRRADLVGFVNGIPLLFMEVKNVHRNIQNAYEENFQDYLDTIPLLFHYNTFVILGNGIEAKIGSCASQYQHFQEWKRLSETDPGIVDMATLLKGICNKNNFIDLLENFILFDESTGKLIKIIARNHQYLGVNLAFASFQQRQSALKSLGKEASLAEQKTLMENFNKLGVFWHTQGSGKSYSILFFTRKIHRKVGGYTFIICTDRDDLDKQIYDTYAGCQEARTDQDQCRATSGKDLQRLIKEDKKYIFTLIQKFNQPIELDQPFSDRHNIIVVSDEAHRTQYGILARNLRDAVPNAGFIGFTGTPLLKEDEITRRYFGGDISTYDFQRAVEDNATVPLYYDARGDKLQITTNNLNETIASKIEELELEDIDIEERLEKELGESYHIITNPKRLDAIAKDFVEHYSTAWENGKVMFVCIDKITCVKMYDLIIKYWQLKIKELKKELKKLKDEQETIYQERKIKWMEETLTGVIISEEQGEVAKFKKHNLDIQPHRKLIKEGFNVSNGKALKVDSAFKDPDHPFRIAIVCAMWLTGFDVPCLSTLYLDKPLKAHTLMQAIARANRIYEGKNNGLIVDYCGILENLRQALQDFAQKADQGRNTAINLDPTRPAEELLGELAEAIESINQFLETGNVSLHSIMEHQETKFTTNQAIAQAQEVINQNDESRKRFEILCRNVFKKYRACLNQSNVNQYRESHNVIKLLYKSLQKDYVKTDITELLQELLPIVTESIQITDQERTTTQLYDISKIDFERLKQEFTKSNQKNTTVQTLKFSVENRLKQLLSQNPQRTNLQNRYEKIIAKYNQSKDYLIIQQTFEALLDFVQNLDQESQRAIREELDEESLAIYDLIIKDSLSPDEIKRIKKTAVALLEKLKSEILKIDQWQEKEFVRDNVKKCIYDFLYDQQEDTGLPDNYTEEEIEEKTEALFGHIFRVYPYLPSPYYSNVA